MRKLISTLAVMAVLAPLPVLAQNAAQPAPLPGAMRWFVGSKDVAAAVAKVKANHKPGQALVVEVLPGRQPYMSLVQLNADVTPANIHEKEAEFFYVVEGSGTVMLGGKLVNEKRVNEANRNGTGGEGGEVLAVSKGDFFWAPANTLHWFNTIKEPLIMVAIHFPGPPPPP